MCVFLAQLKIYNGEGNGTPLQYSCLENPMDRGAWWAAVLGVTRSRTQLSNFTLFFHFHALEKEMATHSSVLAWRIPGMGEPGGLLSMGWHRVGHDWSDLAAAARYINLKSLHLPASGGSDGKESTCNAGDLDSIPGLGRFPRRRAWQPTPCLENPHGQRSLVGYSLWGCKESDMTEQLSPAH